MESGGSMLAGIDLPIALVQSPVRGQNAGLFIARGGETRHPTRIIDSHELILVRQGQLRMWEEHQQFSIEGGQTLHLWPGRRHGGIGTLPNGLEFYWIHFEITADASSTMQIHMPQVQRLIRPDKLESLFRLFLDGQEAHHMSAQSADLIALLMLYEVAQPQASRSYIANALAERARTYIALHYDQPISPGSVARSLGCNPDYLGRIFRAVYRCTLSEAIHQQRIQKACGYLINSDMTIEEITTACGFADSGYFRRIFRRYRHTTPIRYRNMHARVHVNTH